jgi:uncharacterized protein
MNENEFQNSKITPPKDNPGSVWKSNDVLWIIVGIGVLFLIGTLFLVYRYSNSQLVSGLTFQPSIQLSLLMGLLECIALLGGVYLMGIRRRRLSWRAVGLQPLSRKWLWSSLLFGLVAIPVSGLIAFLVQLAVGNPIENPQLDFIVPEGFSWIGLFGMLIVGGIIAPFAEEVFFRGVLYEWIHYRWGVWVGILASSAVFGLLHGEISVAIAAFVLGILLAWTYQRSQSLWSAVIIHVINNSVKILALYLIIALGLSV